MQGMFERMATPLLHEAARNFPAVTILGARQVGKTTLAQAAFPSHQYVDLEDPLTAERFREDPRFALDALSGKGLILDEAQAVPSLFAGLRGAIDAQRNSNGRFIILGSAQPLLVRGVSESLAGRTAVIELDPLSACESLSGPWPVDWKELWLKGGFPDALQGDSRAWWEAYLRMLLERDLPQYGVGADPIFMRRLLTMLAHQHGGLLNHSSLGASLGVSYHVIQRALDVLESVFLIRRLAPWFTNIGKRLVKARKVYLRDTGLLHHLLNIPSHDALVNHPSRGASWEGFVIEDILRRERVAHPRASAWFWRTAAGAEVDLLLDRDEQRIAIEIKAGRGASGAALRALRDALDDTGSDRGWFVDQTTGIDLLGSRIARGGFPDLIGGTP